MSLHTEIQVSSHVRVYRVVGGLIYLFYTGDGANGGVEASQFVPILNNESKEGGDYAMDLMGEFLRDEYGIDGLGSKNLMEEFQAYVVKNKKG